MYFCIYDVFISCSMFIGLVSFPPDISVNLPAKAMGCQVGGGGAKPAFDCNAALGNFARRLEDFNNPPAANVVT